MSIFNICKHNAQTLSNQIKEQAKKTARRKSFIALPENQVYATVENKKLATLFLLKRFRDIRKSKRLTQKNIAQILNVKQPDATPQPSLLELLCQVSLIIANYTII